MWGTRVFEVYGCTETGMVATRRTVDGPVWTAMRDVKIEQRDGEFHAHGGHVQPGRLADRLRLISDSAFELEGRIDDVVNIGGKRASLEGLNRLLLSIDGVIDGAIFEPPATPDIAREPRLMALVVAPADHTRRTARCAARTYRCGVFTASVVARRCAAAQRAGQITEGRVAGAGGKSAACLHRASTEGGRCRCPNKWCSH